MHDEGVGSWPHRRTRVAPDATALTFRELSRTYRELDERVTRLAHALRELGVRPGDRVGLLSRNHPAHLEVLFATALLGGVHAPLNSQLTAPELAFQLSDCRPAVLVHSAELTDTARTAAEQAPVAHRIVLDGEPDAAAHDYDELISTSPTERIDQEVRSDDPCTLMYTSGTTGHPKGVVLTHGNITFAALNPIIDLDIGSAEVALVCAPLFHTAALDFICLPTLLKGGAVHIEEGFDAERVLSAIAERGVTFTFGAPTMLDALAAHPAWAATDLSSLRHVVAAAAPVPERTLRTFTDRGVPICQGYGLTESGPGALILTSDDVRRKLGSAGVPHFFTDVRVVDAEGALVGPGERGEVQICGPNVMVEYFDRPEATAEAFTEDGWLRTGDVGVPDEDGFISVVDRLKDMIVSGGENIYPAEVESALLDLPGVVECAVFGVPDEKWGESACAAVSFEPGAELPDAEVVDRLRERLARYKVPKTFVAVDEIPRNASGKVRKHELRERFAGQDRAPAG